MRSSLLISAIAILWGALSITPLNDSVDEFLGTHQIYRLEPAIAPYKGEIDAIVTRLYGFPEAERTIIAGKS